MVLRKLYIIGAGNFAREAECLLDLIPATQRDWKIEGFLCDLECGLNGHPSDYKVVGKIEDFVFKPGDLALMAIATPAGKEAVYEKLKDKVEFFTYCAPDAIIGKFTTIGKGCFIGPRAIIGPNVSLGDGVFVNSGTMIGHDVVIGAFSSLMANNNVAGHCKIGCGVFFASSVTVIPNRKICDGAFIGAGSVVIQHVKEKRTMFGNPAKYL